MTAIFCEGYHEEDGGRLQGGLSGDETVVIKTRQAVAKFVPLNTETDDKLQFSCRQGRCYKTHRFARDFS
jgi:hypothetical protein